MHFLQDCRCEGEKGKFYSFHIVELLLLLYLSYLSIVEHALLFIKDLDYYWTLIIAGFMQPVAFPSRKEKRIGGMKYPVSLLMLSMDGLHCVIKGELFYNHVKKIQ